MIAFKVKTLNPFAGAPGFSTAPSAVECLKTDMPRDFYDLMSPAASHASGTVAVG